MKKANGGKRTRREENVSRVRLSVLDVSPVASGESARDALLATFATAKHVEALGYERYWVAEHHNAGALACPAPEVLVGQLLACTTRLRVGSGGVMLPNHSPLRIAEAFRVLHALYPDRVDLGIGRAPGTDKRTTALLRRNSTSDFAVTFDELARFFVDEPLPRAPFPTTVVAIPVGVPAPATWLLGTSVESALFAAGRGLGYAYAHHISPQDAESALLAYRAAFVPSHARASPHAIVAVAAAVADDLPTAEALRHASQVSALRFARGERDLPMPTLAEASRHELDEEERAILEAYKGRAFVGATEAIAIHLRDLVARTKADELMLMTNVAPRDLQLASHTSLARALFA